jgi:hypothetical protein
MFSRFPFDGLNLFDGKLVPAGSLPSSYLPVLLAVKLPEIVLVGLVLAVMAGGIVVFRKPRALFDAAGIRWATVAFAGLFPIAYFMILRPVDYNGVRHYLFVVPPLSVLAAAGLDRALREPKARWARGAFALAAVPLAIAPLHALFALHPDEYVYFNALVGGPRGAHGRYELDYWGTSLSDATETLVQELERRGELPKPGHSPLKVYVCGNVWSAAAFFPDSLVATNRIEDADFQIAIDQFYCKAPPSSQRVLGVSRDGALLSYVDDLRGARAAERLAAPELPGGRSVGPAAATWTGTKPPIDVPED